MRRLGDMRLLGAALVLSTALSLVGVASSLAAEKAEKKSATTEEAVPSWVTWLNNGLPFTFGVTGVDVEVGVRDVWGSAERDNTAKFQEYRVLEDGAFIDHAKVSLETKDKKRYIELSAFDAFKEDQSYALRTGKYGEYEVEIFWDQIPHRLSSTGRTLFNTTFTDSSATLTLPPGLASSVQAAATANKPTVLANALKNAIPVDLGFLTSKGGVGLKYAPTDALDFGVKYTYTEKEGTVPFGAGFGGPGSMNEIPAPIFNRTHQVEAKAQYAVPGFWNLGLGYLGSLFEQGIESIQFDNPTTATNSTTLSALGRTTLDPSNQAHNVFLAGGLSLPLRTRITGKFSYGWQLQDQLFVPQTANPVLGVDPRLVLPKSSLDGDVRIILGAINATSRPLAGIPLTLSGGYRYYERDNQTPEIEFPAVVVRDLGPVSTGDRVNAPFSYAKHNARLEGAYPLLSMLNFRLGYEWERWDRNPNLREIGISDEHSLKTSFDFTPLDWLLLRASYRRGWRNVDNYQTQAHELYLERIAGLDPEVSLQAQSVLLRKFDEANRTRDKVEFLASITPLEALSFTTTFSLLQDNFDSSPLGLQESRGWSAGGDLAYSPFKWLSFFVNYQREENKYDQLSRSRPVINRGTPAPAINPACGPGESANTVVCDFPQFNWHAINTDTIDTVGVGADVLLIPDRLSLRVSYSYSNGDTEMLNSNPLGPPLSTTVGQAVGTGGSSAAAARNTATAQDFPTASTQLHTLLASLRYNLTKHWSIKGEYRWEQFRETDWGTDTIGLQGLTTLPPTTDALLGARFFQDYDAHIAAFTVRYQF